MGWCWHRASRPVRAEAGLRLGLPILSGSGAHTNSHSDGQDITGTVEPPRVRLASLPAR